jgi:hypothetical protein
MAKDGYDSSIGFIRYGAGGKSRKKPAEEDPALILLRWSQGG